MAGGVGDGELRRGRGLGLWTAWGAAYKGLVGIGFVWGGVCVCVWRVCVGWCDVWCVCVVCDVCVMCGVCVSAAHPQVQLTPGHGVFNSSCTQVHTYMYMHVRMYVCMYVCMYMHVRTYV